MFIKCMVLNTCVKRTFYDMCGSPLVMTLKRNLQTMLTKLNTLNNSNFE